MILRNVRPWGKGEPVDVAVKDGQIRAIGAALGEGEDFAGRVLLPGLVETHCHLDKTYSLGHELDNQSGTLMEAVERWLDHKNRYTRQDYRIRAEAGLRQALAKGTTALRTHVDMVDRGGLIALEALLELKSVWQPRIDLQIVALGFPGTPQQDDLMREALTMGADVVGGCPALTPDAIACLRSAFLLAEHFDKPLDLHMDETEDPKVFNLEPLAEMTVASGLQRQVTADHCCSLSYQPAKVQQQMMDKLVAADIACIGLPAANLALQGQGCPPARGLMPIKAMRQAGVRTALGSDNVGDPFLPLGNYDLLWQANLAIHAAHLTRPDGRWAALQMVTEEAASVLGLNGYGLEVGCRADLVILDTTSWEGALAQMPPRLRVYKAGNLVFKQEVTWLWT